MGSSLICFFGHTQSSLKIRFLEKKPLITQHESKPVKVGTYRTYLTHFPVQQGSFVRLSASALSASKPYKLVSVIHDTSVC